VKAIHSPSLSSHLLLIKVDYERVVKYNYTSEERFALVEFISMIKGLSGLIMRNEAILSPIIKTAIHDELQEFVQVSLRFPPLLPSLTPSSLTFPGK
jgi:Cytoplasmic Fragile-X interacting family